MLGTYYFIRNVQMIAPKKIELVPNNSTPVAIVAVGVLNEPATATEKKYPYGCI